MPTFGPWDYTVFGAMLLVSISIGIYYAVKSKKRQTTSEYLTAGGSMSFLPVALSLVATFESSVVMLATPAEAYAYGISFFLAEVAMATGILIEIVFALSFVRRLNVKTPFEYLEKRFKSKGLRVLADVLSCLSYVMYSSVVLYGQSIALQTVTGFTMLGSILVTASAAVLYTSLGGIKAVIWTDVLQFVFMVTGLLVIIIKGTVDAGGVDNIWREASESGRLGVSWSPDPRVRHTVWNLYFGRIVTGLGFVYSPAVFQRIASMKSLRETRKALLMVVPLYPLISFMALVIGVVAYGYYYHSGCDPMASGQMESINQIVPFFVMDIFKHLPGLPGLFLVALSSASLSTISSCLQAITMVVWHDFVKPFKPNMSEFRAVLVSKVVVVISGVVGCLLAVILSTTRSRSLNQIAFTLASAIRGPSLAMITVGPVFPFANKKGVVAGFVSGVTLNAWLVGSAMFFSNSHAPYLPFGPTDKCPAYNVSEHFNSFNLTTAYTTENNSFTVGYESSKSDDSTDGDSLSYTLFHGLSFSLTVVVGLIVSWMTGGCDPDPEFVIHTEDFWLCCMTKKGETTETFSGTKPEHNTLCDENCPLDTEEDSNSPDAKRTFEGLRILIKDLHQ